ncbi:HNH endonuclease, partial [bacterium]|nr:HNH endonuclease [bacterium]
TMLEKLMKKHQCDREQVLLMALESLLGESTRVDSGGSPYQVVVQHCPICESKTVGPERRQLSTAESAQIDCDSSVLAPGQRNKSSILPSRRRAVLMHDGHRCQTKGCRSTNFLEVHHLKPHNRGGDNCEENLITLCSSCHRHLHERGGSLAVKAGLAAHTKP